MKNYKQTPGRFARHARVMRLTWTLLVVTAVASLAMFVEPPATDQDRLQIHRLGGAVGFFWLGVLWLAGLGGMAWAEQVVGAVARPGDRGGVSEAESATQSQQQTSSESRYRALFEASRDAIMTLAPPSWRFTSGNPATVRMYGARDETHFTSLGPWELSPSRQPDGRLSSEKAREMIETAMREGSAYFEWTHRRLNGEDFPTTVLLTRVRVGDQVFLQANVRDISAEQQVAESLRQSEDQHRQLFAAAYDAFLVCDLDGIVVEVNPAACRLYGYSREEFVGLTGKDFVHPDYAGQFEEFKRQVKETGQFAAESIDVRKDGSSFHIEVRGSQVMFHGRPHLLATLRDITGRKQEEARTRERIQRVQRENELLAIVAASPAVAEGNVEEVARTLTESVAHALGIQRVGVWLFDAMKTRLLNIDTYTATTQLHESGTAIDERVFRKGFNVLKNAKYIDAHDALTDPRTAGYMDGHFRSLGITSTLQGLIRAQGTDFGALCFAQVGEPHQWEDDEVAFVCQLADQIALAIVNRERNRDQEALRASEQRLKQSVTALEEANRALEELNQLAQSATRAKSAFLANMSHEIRTPMTAILGYADILDSTVERPDQRENVRIIKRNGDHLLAIINDILDLSKIEAGKLEIELEQTSPLALFADIVSLMRVRADAKSLALKLQYRGPLPQTIWTDSARLRQIIVNLVGNAIKFTELGEVRLVVELIDRDTEEPKLRCSVIDSGHGIAPEQLLRLFQPFQQADSSTTRTFGGTGLGLAISKRLAQSLGGDITVDTAIAEGSTFTLTVATGSLAGVPLLERPSESVAPIQANIPAKPAPKMLLNYRILLAEDGADNQRLISQILRRAGAEVEIVENGKKALEKALATYPGWGRRFDDPREPFDVILMDMQMPVMDGYEATRRLRAEGYTRPVLALTAHAMKDDMQKCLDAGCDEYLTKPIVRDKFLDTVARWAARAGAEAEANATAGTPHLS